MEISWSEWWLPGCIYYVITQAVCFWFVYFPVCMLHANENFIKTIKIHFLYPSWYNGYILAMSEKITAFWKHLCHGGNTLKIRVWKYFHWYVFCCPKWFVMLALSTLKIMGTQFLFSSKIFQMRSFSGFWTIIYNANVNALGVIFCDIVIWAMSYLLGLL